MALSFHFVIIRFNGSKIKATERKSKNKVVSRIIYYEILYTCIAVFSIEDVCDIFFI